METRSEIAASIRASQARDAATFAALDQDACQLCGAVGPDKRSVRLSCFYQVSEVVPEMLDLAGVPNEGDYYYLRVCKTCRAGLLGHLRIWREECLARRALPKDSDGAVAVDVDDYPIPVRVDGAIVYMSAEEYDGYARARAQGDPDAQ